MRIFKTGPDFLDPMILERASGHSVQQLDLWMTGESDCRALLYEAARQSDLILVEGVMGLFDGEPSTADLAQKFKLPVVTVINAGSMAQTFHAVAHGLGTFRSDLIFAGALANNVASTRHQQMLASYAPEAWQFFGCLPRSQDIGVPSRHLGLVQAQEISDLDQRLQATALAVAETTLVDFMPPVEFETAEAAIPPLLLAGKRIAVARDAAFSFLYPANLDLLEAMGAQLLYFSPLNDKQLPDCDSVYLPGGYPELHLDALDQNNSMKVSLKKHFTGNKPIYAECGGMLYLLDSLVDQHGKSANMVGILPGQAVLQRKLSALGFQSIDFPQGSLRGHTFHHSLLDTQMQPSFHARRACDGSAGEPVFHTGNLWASYLHLYFPFSPEVVAQIFSGINPYSPLNTHA